MVNLLDGTLYIGQFLSLSKILFVKHYKYAVFSLNYWDRILESRKLVDIGTTQMLMMWNYVKGIWCRS